LCAVGYRLEISHSTLGPGPWKSKPRSRARAGEKSNEVIRRVIGCTFVRFDIEIPWARHKGRLGPTVLLRFPLFARHEVWKEDFRTLSPLFR